MAFGSEALGSDAEICKCRIKLYGMCLSQMLRHSTFKTRRMSTDCDVYVL